MPLFFVYNSSLNQEFNQIKQRIKMLKRTRNQVEYIRELVEVVEAQQKLLDELQSMPYICMHSHIFVDNMPLYIYVTENAESCKVTMYQQVT